MSGYIEEALLLEVEGERLVGILARPLQPARRALIVVVGGPQYRVGSHRQFVLLARHLATSGIAVLRFDVRGMGDAEGEFPGFEALNPDISAAVQGLRLACPGVEQIALWGLCDGASAALMYVADERNPRVDALCLLNPWVRSAASLARTEVKHYYGQRLLSREFWAKLVSGRVNIAGALAELFNKIRLAIARPAHVPQHGFRERMAQAMKGYGGRILLVLSGRDFTAREFLDCAANEVTWTGLIEDPKVARIDLSDSDHTFSTAVWRDAVERATLDWLNGTAAHR
ncbi:MAG: hydrolase 1, exosortase A system-associated [Burkholderiales bacterium]